MAKPFELTLMPGVAEAPRKPGWHKRALAGDKRAQVPATRPSGHRGPNADAKAVDYAEWLAARDGIDLSSTVYAHDWPRVMWESCGAGMRPRHVVFGRPGAPIVIDLPHWSYEAPPVVVTTAPEWHAPIVRELHGAEREAVLGEIEEAESGAWCEAVWDLYGDMKAYGLDGTDDAAALPPAGDPTPPLAAIPTPAPVEAIGEARTVTAICASHKARRNLLRRVGDVPPAYSHEAKGGAFLLTLSEAAAAADVKCVRLIGLPRKPYTRAAVLSPAPREAIAAHHPHPAQSAPFLAALAGPMRPGYAACHSASFT